MPEASGAEIQPTRVGASWFWRRLKWGLFFAGSYLLVSVPCTVAYLADRYEYSVPLLVVYITSYPTHLVLFEVLRPLTLRLERVPYAELLALSLLLGSTSLLYFAIGQSIGWAARAIARWRA